MFCRKYQTDLQDLALAVPSLMHCTYYMGQSSVLEESPLEKSFFPSDLFENNKGIENNQDRHF